MSTNTQYHRSITRNAGAFTQIQQKLSLAVNVYQGELVGSTEIQVAPSHKDLTSICLHSHHSLEQLDVNINGYPAVVNRRDGYVQNSVGINTFAKTVDIGKDYEGMKTAREALKLKKTEKKSKSNSNVNAPATVSVATPAVSVKMEEVKVENVVKLEATELTESAIVESGSKALDEPTVESIDAPVLGNTEPTTVMEDTVDIVPVSNGPEPGYNPPHSILDGNYRYSLHTEEEGNVFRPQNTPTIVGPSMQYNLAMPPPSFNINTMTYNSYPLHAARQLNIHGMIQTEQADLTTYGQIEILFPSAVRSLQRFDTTDQVANAPPMHELPVLTIRIVYKLNSSNAGLTFHQPIPPMHQLEQLAEEFPDHQDTIQAQWGDMVLSHGQLTAENLKDCLIKLSHTVLPTALQEGILKLLTAQVNPMPMVTTSTSLTNSPYFWMPCLATETHRGLLSISIAAPAEFTVLCVGEKTVLKTKTSKKKDADMTGLTDLASKAGMEESLGWLINQSKGMQTTKFEATNPLSMQQLGLIIAPLSQTVPPITNGRTAVTLHYTTPTQYREYAQAYLQQCMLSLQYMYAYKAVERGLLQLPAENKKEVLLWLRQQTVPFPTTVTSLPIHRLSPLQFPYHLRHQHDITYAAYVHHTLDDSKLVTQLVHQYFATSAKQMHVVLIPGLAREYISSVQMLCIRPEVLCGPQHVEQTLYIRGVIAQGVIEALLNGDLLIKQDELWVTKGIVSRLVFLYIQIALGHNEAEYRLLASRSGACRQYDLINKPGPEYARLDLDRGKAKKRGRGRKRGKAKVDLHDMVDEPAEAFTESTQIARTAVKENDACPLEWVVGGHRDQSYIDTAVDFHITSLSMPNSPITAIANDTSSFLKAVEMPELYAGSSMSVLDVLLSINPANVVASTRYNLSTGAPEELHPFLKPVPPRNFSIQEIVSAVVNDTLESLLESATVSPSTITMAPAITANTKGMLDFCMKTSHTFFSSRTHVLPRYSLKFAVPLTCASPAELINMDLTGMASGVSEALVTSDFGFHMKAESVFNALYVHFGDSSFATMWNRLIQYHSLSSLTPNRDMKYLSDNIFRVYFEQSNLVDSYMAQYVLTDALPLLFLFSRYDPKDKKMYVYNYQIQKYAFVRKPAPPPKLTKVTAELVNTVKSPYGSPRTWYDLTELYTYEDLRSKLSLATSLKFHGSLTVSLYESEYQPVSQQKLTTDAVSSCSIDCQVVSRKPKKNKRDAPRNNVDVIDSNIRGLLADEHHRWIRPIIFYLHVSHILFALKSKFLSDQFRGVHAARRLDLSLHDPVYRHELECNEQGKRLLVQLAQANAGPDATDETMEMASETLVSDVSYGLRETIMQINNFWRVRTAAVSNLLEVDREERPLHQLTEIFTTSLEFKPETVSWRSTTMPEEQGFWLKVLTSFSANIKQILGAHSVENYSLEDLVGYTYKLPSVDDIAPFCGHLSPCGLGSDNNATWLANYITQKCFMRYTYHVTVPYTLLKRLSKYVGDIENTQTSEF